RQVALSCPPENRMRADLAGFFGKSLMTNLRSAGRPRAWTKGIGRWMAGPAFYTNPAGRAKAAQK
ncbi:MAG: hypothetical protein Q8K90_00025, partial [Brevundimonas sp.]|nr:hypothetical protein [Brevundimonas sp.]